MIQKALQHKGYLLFGILFIILMITLSLLYSCKDEQSTSIDKTLDEKKPVRVGILFDNYVVERWTSDRDAFEEAINSSNENITVTSKNANSDINIQIEQLNKLIDDNYNIIAIVPIDPKQLAKSVKKAKEKGITVISYDRLLTGCGCDLYLSFDNKKVGTLMGNSIKKLDIPNKKVIMLSGPDTDYNATLVNKGFKDVLNENDIEIIDEKHIENWDYDLALEYINNNLGKVNKANIIMCGNDTIARRVIESLASNNIKGKYVLGQDGNKSALQKIYEGTQYMSVYKPVTQLAKKTADIVIELSKGSSIDDILSKESSITTINDNTTDIPFIYFEPTAITKDNIKKEIFDKNIYSKNEIDIFSS